MLHQHKHRGKITALFCIALLTPKFAAADVVRSEGEFGCRSRETFQILQKFISKRDTNSINNAIKNGECIRIPFGIDVEIVKGKEISFIILSFTSLEINRNGGFHLMLS